jgi:hypothetical protein
VGGPVGGPVSDPHSPLQATALTRHRAAAIDLDPVAVRWALAPMNADPQRLFRWEPWVRSYLITQELLRPLDFVELRADEAVGSHGTRMVVRDADGAPHALATLIAPPMAVFTGSPDAKPPQRGQIDLVLGWAQLREERQPEILTQLHDQFAFWGSLVPIHTERMRRTRQARSGLLAAARLLAAGAADDHHAGPWRTAQRPLHAGLRGVRGAARAAELHRLRRPRPPCAEPAVHAPR